MADNRVRGQEVEAILVVDGVAQTTITDIRSFEVAVKLETKEEAYLGETTNRYDTIYNGARGRMEFHYENADVFTMVTSLIDVAKRRTPGVQVNVKATLNFSNGDRPIILVSDVQFGEIPFNFASRSDYGTFSLEFQASDVAFL